MLGLLAALGRRPQIYLGIFFCAVSLQISIWLPSPSNLVAKNRESDLRILVTNVNTQNKNYDSVIDLVRTEKPDLAIFMEIDRLWQAELATLENLLPYSSIKTHPDSFGLLVYSNLPQTNTQIKFFNRDRNSSVVTQIAIAGQPITLLATHPLPPAKPSFFDSRNKQMDAVGQYLSAIDGRIILAGDLNMSMWSPYYRRLGDRTNLNNARQGFGVFPSWATPGTYKQIPGWLTSMLAIPIDHCLISQGLKATQFHTGSAIGSDHLPIIVDLKVT